MHSVAACCREYMYIVIEADECIGHCDCQLIFNCSFWGKVTGTSDNIHTATISSMICCWLTLMLTEAQYWQSVIHLFLTRAYDMAL